MVRGHNGVDKQIYLGKQSRNSVSSVKQRGKFDSFYPIYNWVLHLVFNPCNDKCTYEGSHCQGCGRSHQEIADTKKMVMSIVNFIQDQDYENCEEFVNTISKSVLKKLQNPV